MHWISSWFIFTITNQINPRLAKSLNWNLFIELASGLIGLLVYWHTAKAFGGNTTNYFEYIVIGETSLFIPIFLITQFQKKIKEGKSDGTLEALLLIPDSESKFFLIYMMPEFIKELLRSQLTFIASMFAIIFFAPNIEMINITDKANSWILFTFIQISFIPMFFFLGSIIAMLYLITQRGEGFLHLLQTIGVFLSGAYFPTSVFPQNINVILKNISPLYYIVQNTRHAVETKNLFIFEPSAIIPFLLINLILGLISSFLKVKTYLYIKKGH